MTLVRLFLLSHRWTIRPVPYLSEGILILALSIYMKYISYNHMNIFPIITYIISIYKCIIDVSYIYEIAIFSHEVC